jgi:transposase
MQETSARPSWIIGFERPPGTEIKHINGHYYLYERLSVYDPKTKKKRKKSGRLIGTITPDGLVRKKERLESAELTCIENREYGASMFLYQSSSAIAAKLEACFPLVWREILAMAVMRCMEQCPFKRIGHHYSLSYLSEVLGDLSLSPAAITGLLKKIGTDRGAIRQYMKADLDRAGILMVDGHRLISCSENMEYARLGYDSRMRYMPQINLIYLFSVSSEGRLPVYYKQFSGDVPDVSAFEDILSDSSLRARDITLVADKGFGSGDNFDLIADSGIAYVIPLKRGTIEIPELPEGTGGYEHVFNFRGRPVYSRTYRYEGHQVILYHDTELSSNETADLVDRLNKKNGTMDLARQKEETRRGKGKPRLSDVELDKLKPVDIPEMLRISKGIGTFVLKTNRLDLNSQQVHHLYKTRQEIEQTFKSYDNTLDCSASYMRDIHSFEAWLFINHLALQMLYGILDLISTQGLTGEYSFEDMISYLKGVRVNLIGGKWYPTKITKKTTEFCERLHIDLNVGNLQ